MSETRTPRALGAPSRSRSEALGAGRYAPVVTAEDWMDLALDEARAALDHDDVPIGAIVVAPGGGVVARRHNEREKSGDPTAHAEVLALRDAAAEGIDGWRLEGHTLVATLEPCPMCAGAALLARVDTVVFAAADPKAGALGSLYNFAADPRLRHEMTLISGVRAEESASLLQDFFRQQRSAGSLLD